MLYADDDPELTRLVKAYLDQLDDSITVFSETGVEAWIRRLKEDTIDCKISDHEMPEKNGIEFLQMVREEYPEIPFLLFTSLAREELESEATEAGVTRYLPKSCNGRYEIL